MHLRYRRAVLRFRCAWPEVRQHVSHGSLRSLGRPYPWAPSHAGSVSAVELGEGSLEHWHPSATWARGSCNRVPTLGASNRQPWQRRCSYESIGSVTEPSLSSADSGYLFDNG